jgi:hypothetical protein
LPKAALPKKSATIVQHVTARVGFRRCPDTQNACGISTGGAGSEPETEASNTKLGAVYILRVSIIDTFLRGNEATRGYLPRDPVATHC